MGRLHPHARGALVPDRQQVLRLEVRVRARAAHGRTPHLSRAWQGAGRFEQHQRHDLPARQPARLRALGRRPRHGGVGLRALPAVLQAHGDLHRRRRHLARRRRAAGARAGARHEPAVPRLLRGRAAGRLPADQRRQRLPPGGLRRVRPQHPPRTALERRPRLPAPGREAPQPRGAHAHDGEPRAVRGHARGRGRGRQRRQIDRAHRGRRGDPLRRRDQLAAAAPALGRRQRRRAARARDRRRRGPARGRREPPGPPRGLRPVRVHQAGLDGARAQVAQPARRSG